MFWFRLDCIVLYPPSESVSRRTRTCKCMHASPKGLDEHVTFQTLKKLAEWKSVDHCSTESIVFTDSLQYARQATYNILRVWQQY